MKEQPEPWARSSSVYTEWPRRLVVFQMEQSAWVEKGQDPPTLKSASRVISDRSRVLKVLIL